MKVCFDTNVIIDILASTEDILHSYSSYDVAVTKDFEVCMPMFTSSDIAYILYRNGFRGGQLHERMQNLFEMFDIFDGQPSDSFQALESGMTDYEDALLAYAAKRNNIDLIVTRNKKDFAHSPVDVITPQEFVELFKPPNVSYSLGQVDDEAN